MSLYCSVSCSNPASTNIVMGSINESRYYIEIDSLSKSDKNIVDDFISIIGEHAFVLVENYINNNLYEINIVTPKNADLEQLEIDFNSFSTSDKNKINAFIELITKNLE